MPLILLTTEPNFFEIVIIYIVSNEDRTKLEIEVVTQNKD